MTQTPQADQIQTAALCLLATTDLHMHLTGWDYAKDRPLPDGGLGKIADLIEQARAEAMQNGAEVLLFDNGDSMQGTVLADLAQETPDQPHPLMQALDILGYDAVGLGNHDFDFGLAALNRAYAAAPCPVICSNVTPTPDVATTSTILDVETPSGHLRIGVFSVLPPQTMLWNADRLAGVVRIEDMTTAARRQVSALRADGCDLVVALAHTGLGDAQWAEGQENAIGPIARLKVDAVFAGHTHQPLARIIDGVPTVLAGANGTQLARIDLSVQRGPDQRWTLTRAAPALLSENPNPPDPLPRDPRLRDVLRPWHDTARRRMTAPVGQSAHPLHSHFAMVHPDRHLHFIAEAMYRAATDGAGTPLTAPVLAAIAPAKCGGRGGPEHFTDIPAGPVLQRHLQDLVHFPNSLRAVRVSGRVLLDWMEMAASVFHALPDGTGATALLNDDWPPHAFDTFFGLEYRIDLQHPPRFRPDGTEIMTQGRRIVDVRCQGRPVLADDMFTVLLTDYRANGGGNVPGLHLADRVDVPQTPLRDAARDLLSRPMPRVYAPTPWQFAPHPGKRLQVPVGPAALAHLGDIAHLHPSVAKTGPDGFVPLTIRL